jgi:hypothetical protein
VTNRCQTVLALSNLRHYFEVLCNVGSGMAPVAPFPNAIDAVSGRALHSSTSHVNLSRFCLFNHPTYHTKRADVELKSGRVQAPGLGAQLWLPPVPGGLRAQRVVGNRQIVLATS